MWVVVLAVDVEVVAMVVMGVVVVAVVVVVVVMSVCVDVLGDGVYGWIIVGYRAGMCVGGGGGVCSGVEW